MGNVTTFKNIILDGSGNGEQTRHCDGLFMDAYIDLPVGVATVDIELFRVYPDGEEVSFYSEAAIVASKTIWRTDLTNVSVELSGKVKVALTNGTATQDPGPTVQLTVMN